MYCAFAAGTFQARISHNIKRADHPILQLFRDERLSPADSNDSIQAQMPGAGENKQSEYLLDFRKA